jgi:hypothetical protein
MPSQFRKRAVGAFAVAAVSLGVAVPAYASAPVVGKATTPTVASPKVVTLKGFGKYRLTNGRHGLVATRLGAKATASAAYLHQANANQFCTAWNNQSAYEQIRYVEMTMYRAPMYLATSWGGFTRYSNTNVVTGIYWYEQADHSLAIYYQCQITGDDSSMNMYSVMGSSVYWAS